MLKLSSIALVTLFVFTAVFAVGCEGCGCSDSGLIAELKQMSGSVERDYAFSVGKWSPAELKDGFRMGDGVQTFVGSQAIISMAEDAELHLKEKTQIRFLDKAPEAQGIGLKVESGEAEIVAGTDEFELITDLGTAVLSSGGRMRVTKTESGFDLRVELGAARLFRKGEPTEDIGAGESFKLAIGDVEILPMSPKIEELPSEETELANEEKEGDLGIAKAVSSEGVSEKYERGPELADLAASVGDSFTLHATTLPVVVAFNTQSLCSSETVVTIVGSKGGFTGSQVVNVPFNRGNNRYRVYCMEEGVKSAKPVAGGRTLVLKDSGRGKLPKKAPLSTVEADGRKYKILYQNRMPEVRVRWKKAPKASSYSLVVVYASGKSDNISLNSAEYRFNSGKLKEGTHRLRFIADGTSWKSKQTTVEVKFDNAAPKASWNQPAEGGFAAGQTVALQGVTVSGWQVSSEGQVLNLDSQYRFTGRVLYTGKYRGIVLRLVHPKRGVHLYLRRGRENEG